MKMKTLEEKLTDACGSEKAQEVIEIFSNHFQIDKFELKQYYSKVCLTSDNTLLGTEIKFGRKQETIPVYAIQWNLKGNDEIGQLTLTFL